MSMLSDGMEWLADTLADTDVGGVSVTYTRAGNSVTLTAVLGQSLLRIEDQATGTSRVERTHIDIFVTAADLILNSVATLPQTGDRFTVAGSVYEVTPIATEPAWRYSDPEGNVFRIHGKRRGAA